MNLLPLGVKMLIKEFSKDKNLDSLDIAFKLAPKLNSAGRMGDATISLKLFINSDKKELEMLVQRLIEMNTKRQEECIRAYDDCKSVIANNKSEFNKAIILKSENWDSGLLGITCARLVEEFSRPVFLWGRAKDESEDEENILKGSCRSEGQTDLVAVMEKTREIFVEFGGHKMSGGFSVSFEKIHLLEESLVTASNLLCEENKKGNEKIFADAELHLKNVNEKTVSEISKLSPFGVGNEKPIFIFRDVIPEKINRFGKAKEHLSINFRDGESTARAISFFTSPDQFGDALKEGIKTNLVANLEKSFYNGSSEIRLRIVDIF